MRGIAEACEQAAALAFGIRKTYMAKVENTAENFAICMQDGSCKDCPSYAGGGNEGLYCARGKSTHEIAKKCCNCPECPVWMNNQLMGMYFCDAGAAT